MLPASGLVAPYKTPDYPFVSDLVIYFLKRLFVKQGNRHIMAYKFQILILFNQVFCYPGSFSVTGSFICQGTTRSDYVVMIDSFFRISRYYRYLIFPLRSREFGKIGIYQPELSHICKVLNCGIHANFFKGFERTYPHQVSGGMAQRASLARALINDPKVLLLDEPLGALDAFTRMDLQDKILELWGERGTTTVLVTHDVDEAVYLSDRIVIMTPRPGKIEEVLNVSLPRPRSRGDAEFLELRTRILEKLHFVSRAKDPEYFL